jgi:hypothetical protein
MKTLRVQEGRTERSRVHVLIQVGLSGEVA